MAIDLWENNEVISKEKINGMVNQINSNAKATQSASDAATKATTDAKNAKAAVDGLEVGARNYVYGVANSVTLTGTSSFWDKVCKLKLTEDLSEKNVVISCDVLIDKASDGKIYCQLNANYAPSWWFPVWIDLSKVTPGQTYHYVQKATWPKWIGTGVDPILSNDSPTIGLVKSDVVLTFSHFQIKLGNSDTDVGPAPEDKANDAEVGHLANDQTWAGVNNFNNLQINGQNLDAYIAAQISKYNGGGLVNLFTGGDMEGDIGWLGNVNGGQFVADTAQFHTGSKSLKITVSASATTSSSGISFPAILTDGKQYMSTGWLYSEVPRTIRINGYSQYWKTPVAYSVALPANQWTYFTTPLLRASNPPTTAHDAGYAIFINGTTGNDIEPFWLDDFNIWELE